MVLGRWKAFASLVMILPLLVGCAVGKGLLGKATPTPLPVVKTTAAVVATGHVVPRQYARLAPATTGTVVAIDVAAGDRVQAGQRLLKLDDAQQRAAVAEADAGLKLAQARLAQVQAAPEAQQIASAQAAVTAAKGSVQSATGVVDAANAQLARLQAGATAEEIGIAQRQVEAAKNALYSAQAQRDSICGQQGAQANCDAARGAVQQAEENVRIGELRLAQMLKGATAEDLAAAKAQVRQAQGQLEAAQAAQAQAEAALALLLKGATAETIAVAARQVDQARAALERAQLALADTELRAPLAGEVAGLNARVGEKLSPAGVAVQLADLSSWEVETDDLTEIAVVKVSPGQQVNIVPDALPGVTLAGTVAAVDQAYGEKQGDVVYTVHIQLEDADPRLRWGMTVTVSFP